MESEDLDFTKEKNLPEEFRMALKYLAACQRKCRPDFSDKSKPKFHYHVEGYQMAKMYLDMAKDFVDRITR